MSTNHILAAFAGALALVNPAQQARFNSCVSLAADHMAQHRTEFATDRMDADSDWWGDPGSFRATLRPYVVVDGILQIPVKGVLLHDFPYALFDYATGYDYIWRAFQRGMTDLNVQGIALVCDTPGGMVAGCFDCVDRMFALKGETGKPVRGYAAESAYSAGYAVISVCDTITVSRTGGVGSVGVVTSHCDLSGALAQDGVKVTFIYAGKHKVDGNSYEALPDDVKARIQARIDETYEVFVSTVARNRPALTVEDARASEALCFTATQALSNRFADAIGALDDSLADYAADLSSDEGDDEMSTPDKAAEQAATQEAAVTAARTEGHAAGRTEGHASGLKEGATAERTRISAIIGSDAGKERPVAAMAAAMDTDMTADAAQSFLAKLPKESATAPADQAQGGFNAAMDASGNPNLGAGGGGTGGASENSDDASSVLTLVRASGLGGFKTPAAA